MSCYIKYNKLDYVVKKKKDKKNRLLQKKKRDKYKKGTNIKKRQIQKGDCMEKRYMKGIIQKKHYTKKKLYRKKTR